MTEAQRLKKAGLGLLNYTKLGVPEAVPKLTADQAREALADFEMPAWGTEPEAPQQFDTREEDRGER